MVIVDRLTDSFAQQLNKIGSAAPEGEVAHMAIIKPALF